MDCCGQSSSDLQNTSRKKKHEKLFRSESTSKINRARKDRHTNSNQAQSTLANGRVAFGMDWVSKRGLMARSTSGSGEKTEHMVKANLFMWTEMFMMVSGPMIKPTVLAFTNMLTVPCMRASGRMICSTVVELKPGPIRVATKETTDSDASTASAVTAGVMEASTLVTGAKIKSAGLEYTRG